jgi:serine/threonine protein kinase
LPETALSLPTTIGNYRIERELGRGGMGAVYIGVHQLIGKRAAIKVLLPQVSQRADLVQRFFNEARAATAIRHPGIVEVYDYGIGDDGNAFLVMEYLEGETLASRLQTHGRLHVPVAVVIARQIALALGAAHRAGIVHRDLKPDNVFLTLDQQSKLLDFGVAKLVDDAGTAGPATVTGAILGTPAYMSPEQCEGSRVVDHRSDLYSLGCTLFLMLTGRLPFLETGIGGLIGAHLHTPAPALRDHCATASPELAELVARLLAKSPDARFQSADAVAAALADPAASLVVAPAKIAETPPASPSPRFDATQATQVPPPRTPTAGAPTRRRWFLVFGALVIAGAIAAAIVAQGGSESIPPVEATRSDIPIPTVDRPAPEMTPVQAHLVIARQAVADGKFEVVANALRELAKLSPADAAKLEAEVAPKAIEAAAKQVRALRDQHECELAKAAALTAKKQWGPSPLLESAAENCKPVERPGSNAPPPDPALADAVPAIRAAFAASQYRDVVERCKRHPPDRPQLYVPCMVSACKLDKGALALAWMQRTRTTKAETTAINLALDRCLSEAGINLSSLAAKKRQVVEQATAEDPDPPRSNDDLAKRILAAYAARKYDVTVKTCSAAPRRPDIYVACVVAACHLKRADLALIWLRDPPSARAMVDTLNVCHTLGVELRRD